MSRDYVLRCTIENIPTTKETLRIVETIFEKGIGGFSKLHVRKFDEKTITITGELVLGAIQERSIDLEIFAGIVCFLVKNELPHKKLTYSSWWDIWADGEYLECASSNLPEDEEVATVDFIYAVANVIDTQLAYGRSLDISTK